MGDDAGVRSRVSVAGVSVSVDHYVGGRRLSSPTTFEDRSPLDWSTVLAEVSAGDAATADAALAAATEAFEGWAALGPGGRAPHLRRLADLIDERVADIAAVECVDMGMSHESLRNRVIGTGLFSTLTCLKNRPPLFPTGPGRESLKSIKVTPCSTVPCR